MKKDDDFGDDLAGEMLGNELLGDEALIEPAAPDDQTSATGRPSRIRRVAIGAALFLTGLALLGCVGAIVVFSAYIQPDPSDAGALAKAPEKKENPPKETAPGVPSNPSTDKKGEPGQVDLPTKDAATKDAASGDKTDPKIGLKDAKEPKDGGGPSDVKEIKEPRDTKEPKEPKVAEDGMQPKDKGDSSPGIDPTKPEPKPVDYPQPGFPFERNREINPLVPLKAVATLKRLQEIQGVEIDGEIRFAKSDQVNRVSIYWEGLDLYRQDEWHTTVHVSRILVVDTAAWHTSFDKTVPLVGEEFAFYRNFNVPMMAGSMIPFAKTRFEIQREAGEQTVRGEKCFVLRVSRKDRIDMQMYFARSDQLLRKVSFRTKLVNAKQQLAPDETDIDLYFRDYQEKDGVKHWRKCEQWRDQAQYMELTVKNLHFTNTAQEKRFLVKDQEKEVKAIFEVRRRFHQRFVDLEKSLAAEKFAEVETMIAELDPQDPRTWEAVFPVLVNATDTPKQKFAALIQAEKYDEALILAGQVDTYHAKVLPLVAKAVPVSLHDEWIKLREENQNNVDMVHAFMTREKVRAQIRLAQGALHPDTDTKKAQNAIDLFEEAQAALQKSNALPPGAAKAELEQIRSGIKQARNFLLPLRLDPSDTDSKKAWQLKDVTLSRETPKGTVFQAKATEASLLSAEAPFPPQFDLNIKIILLDRAGSVRNTLWKAHPSLMKITLLPVRPKDDAVVIEIGQDRKYSFDKIGLVSVNKASSSTAALETEPGASEIILSQNETKLTVKIAGKTVATLPAGAFNQLTIRLSNGLDGTGSAVAIPGLAGVTLRRQE